MPPRGGPGPCFAMGQAGHGEDRAKKRAISAGSRVRGSARARRMRAFYGDRLPAGRNPSSLSLPVGNTRPEPARVDCMTMTPRATASRSGSNSPRAAEARREAGRDDSLGTRGQEGADRGAVRAGIGDIQTRLGREAPEVEGRIRCAGAQRAAVVVDAVSIGLAQHAEIGRAEGLHPAGGGLRHLPRGLALVVQHRQRPHAMGGGMRRDADGIDEVQLGIPEILP